MNYSLIVTSCNRFDLLKRTLDSFFRFCDVLPMQVIISDDSGETLPLFANQYHPNTVNLYSNKQGQIQSIDNCIAHVTEDYFFHLEDDWEFYRSGFISESFNVLKDRNIINHWLRERTDTNGHPIKGDYLIHNYKNVWHGFTFNPTLKRMDDYRAIGSYGLYGDNKFRAWENESAIGTIYKNKGFIASIAKQGYVKHIGVNRHVKQGI